MTVEMTTIPTQELLSLQTQLRRAQKSLTMLKGRTDNIRDAVADFLSGDITRSDLQRALHDTGYDQDAFEEMEAAGEVTEEERQHDDELLEEAQRSEIEPGSVRAIGKI